MRALFLAAIALGMLAAGAVFAADTSSSNRAGTQVIGPTVTRELASQTTKQLSGAVSEATRASMSAATEGDR